MAANSPSQADATQARREATIVRLTNLTFALQGAVSKGGNPERDMDWIRARVDGYGHYPETRAGNDAFYKAVTRDVTTLQRAGVPVSVRKAEGSNRLIFRMEEDQYQLPEVDFSPEEARVLGLASGMGQPGGLTDYSAAGWTKIAASGASRGLDSIPVVTANFDAAGLDATVLRDLNTAYRLGLRISFNYQQRPDADPVRRRMEPWGVVAHEMRNYLVGYDLDRNAPRVFRLARVSDVSASRAKRTVALPTRPLQEFVTDILKGGEKITATVRIPHGHALELADAGQPRGDGTYVLESVPRDWLLRTAASFAPGVEVLEPEELRREIAQHLQAVIEGPIPSPGVSGCVDGKEGE